MSATFDSSLVAFQIVDNKLVGKDGKSVTDTFSTLTFARPEKAVGDEPCIVVATARMFGMRPPGANEHRWFNTEDEKFEIFWAIQDSVPVLIIDKHDHILSNHGKTWRRIQQKAKWQRMPGRQLVRLFESAEEARKACPDEIVIIPAEFGNWQGIEVQAANLDHQGIINCTMQSMIDSLKIPPDGANVPIGKWTEHELDLANASPNVWGKWRKTSGWDENDDPPRIVKIILGQDGETTLLVTYEEGPSKFFVWRRFSFAEARRLFHDQ